MAVLIPSALQLHEIATSANLEKAQELLNNCVLKMKLSANEGELMCFVSTDRVNNNIANIAIRELEAKGYKINHSERVMSIRWDKPKDVTDAEFI